MDKIIRNIIRTAKKAGACGKIEEATDIRSLVKLFFSPQGKEFCEEKNFPPLATFLRLNETDMPKYGIYVDSGAITLRNKENIAIVGRTQAELIYEGIERRYTVILMHGATARIRACSHSVIEVVNIGCRVTYDIDKTVVLL